MTATDNPTQSLWQRVRRWARHLWLDAADVRRCLPPDSLARLEEQVRVSETRHRGELRLCVEGGLDWPALWAGTSAHARGIELFSQLRVWDTEHNNGVLVYLLLAERRIEILADRGIAQVIDATIWQTMVDGLREHLQQGRYETGLSQAIDQVSMHMRRLYPLEAPGQHNPDELPNAVVIL